MGILVAVFSTVSALTVAGQRALFAEHHGPALEEIADDPVWDEVPSNSAVWESADSHTRCGGSEAGESRTMGLFVVDPEQALSHYEAVMVEGGWSVEPVEVTREGRVLRATKRGEHGLLTIEVTAGDRADIYDIEDGELVPEGRPDGFERDSDYLTIVGRPDPQCPVAEGS